MESVLRKIVHIDEEKCNGCGLCVPACAEGAIQIIDGKARLVDDKFCDGLGACLGECPQDAIIIEERKAVEFDEQAAALHVKQAENKKVTPISACPGAAVQSFSPSSKSAAITNLPARSYLENWPIQLHLIPPHAPFLKDADLLICADCVPFAYAGFHQELLKDKTLIIACPKLDDVSVYMEKLQQIFKTAKPKNITILHMEVPCCYGLVNLVKQALSLSGEQIDLREQVIGAKGNKL